MLGAATRGVKTIRLPAIVVCCALVASGCFWHRYSGRVGVHTEVLVAVARKVRDLVATGRFTAETLPELTYPLERAQAFASDAERHLADGQAKPPSLVAFEELVAAYRRYVESVDEARRRPPDGDPAAGLAAPLAAVETAAKSVTAALATDRS